MHKNHVWSVQLCTYVYCDVSMWMKFFKPVSSMQPAYYREDSTAYGNAVNSANEAVANAAVVLNANKLRKYMYLYQHL